MRSGETAVKRDTAKVKEETAALLGEHKIIELMRKYFEPMPDIVVPFGDDLSALPIPAEGQVAALKTDMLVAKTDVPPDMNLWQAARKAIVMNISDFAAKGIQPLAALVALGIPKNLTQSELEDIAKGLNAGARQYGAYVVGGDTGEASDLIISVHLYGVSQKNGLMLRKGTKPGDILAVTGTFGKTSAGLKLLLNPDTCRAPGGLRERLLSAVFMPQAHLAEGLALRASDAVTACMDSSDGLAWTLHELAFQNEVGFEVTELPVADEARQFAAENRSDAAELALYGGEEYELVLTVDAVKWERAKAAVEAIGGRLIAIGKATSTKETTLITVDGKKQPILPKGWEHFKTKI